MAAGLLGGALMAGLTVCLTQWKPSFGKVAFWIGMVHLAFWAIAVTVAEACVLDGKVGRCVSGVLWSLLMDLPMVLMYLSVYLRDWHQHLLPSSLFCLAHLLVALLVAFYSRPLVGGSPRTPRCKERREGVTGETSPKRHFGR